ncbi:variant erythrocyte surface antigen-1 family protein [Babesia divergens]|uniref:Variant erythrocyte surface antigen-1 family protein n=1 Tax=Babesia divergens TaxID=32595 RepID=A0AAD9G5H8_BABDI|nr:variant erythrocyte surface antigen-1 family protein [Babesia divergens]
MYYTDVFVGPGNIEKLRKALKAELKDSGLKTVDLESQLTALAEGLEKFIGYGSGGSGIGKSGQGGSQYESSYKNASWPECKQSGTCSCSSSCSHSGSSSSTSCHGSCCPNCDVRKAAKIFLGMLPCLFHALKYLNEKCKGDWNWKNFKISDHDKPLHRFLSGMGFDLAKLQDKKGSAIPGFLETLFTGSNGPLKKLYEKSKKYFTSSSHSHSLVPSSTSSDSQPKTVRDILLWLSGLPFTSGFKDLLKHCESLCSDIKDSKGSVTPENFKSYLFDSCFLSPFVLGAIEGSKSNEKDFPPYKSEWQNFSYPEDPFKLFETFCDFVRKIYIALNFLCIQCKNDSGQGGWKDCYFGKDCAEKFNGDSSTSGSTSPSTSCCPPGSGLGILCTASDTPDVHGKHCDPNGAGKGQCINLNSGSCTSNHNTPRKPCIPCPHPLMRFLTADPSCPFRLPFSFAQLDFSQSPPVILDASSDKDFLTMGFSQEKLPKEARQGNSIAPILNSFCGLSSSPLTKLFEFSLFVAMRPPETLIELYVFFVKFRLNLRKDLSSKFIDWISKEPGKPSGQNLKTAIEKLDGSHSGSSHSDLKSLYACDGPGGPSNSTSTCGRYLFPLNNVAGVFTPEFCAVYLSWVCHLGKALKALLEKFKKDFSKSCEHCSSGSCQKIVECPCALPFLYSWGFSFWSPNTLNCPGHEGHSTGQNCILRSCKDFIDQLGHVANGDPFKTLIAEIDNFLWSIRKPFFLFVLAFWAFVFSYFLYVQLYKLDVLELNSHDHPAWSFKIPPSILFSDASSKLKDLSYFTL